jgi:hypothetical protein
MHAGAVPATELVPEVAPHLELHALGHGTLGERHEIIETSFPCDFLTKK